MSSDTDRDQLELARDIITDLEDLIRRAAKTSVEELSPDLAHRIMVLNGCPECARHPDTHCDECQMCPCDCEDDRE